LAEAQRQTAILRDIRAALTGIFVVLILLAVTVFGAVHGFWGGA
jgi:hypothetical protein